MSRMVRIRGVDLRLASHPLQEAIAKVQHNYAHLPNKQQSKTLMLRTLLLVQHPKGRCAHIVYTLASKWPLHKVL